jgi:hypothetical protein
MDIFISYATPDREWAGKFADTLTAKGWGVWWDRAILPGDSFHTAISDALERCRCVTVVWSKASIKSEYVLAEAHRGRDRGVLRPVIKEAVVLPVPFNIVQTADLTEWKSGGEASALGPYFQSMNSLLGHAQVLPLAEGARLIGQFASMRRVRMHGEIGEVSSSTGAHAFKMDAVDHMGSIYCHRSGRYAGQVFHVRKGIALFYHHDHGGAAGVLGLPVSNEEVAEGAGFPTSYFENGLIEWSPKSWHAQAYLTLPDGTREAHGKSRYV